MKIRWAGAGTYVPVRVGDGVEYEPLSPTRRIPERECGAPVFLEYVPEGAARLRAGKYDREAIAAQHG